MSTPTEPHAETIRRVLIVGVSGYLGSAIATGLRNEFEVFGSYYRNPVRIEGVTSFQMGLTNGGEIIDALRKYKPEAIIYAAGMSDMKSCVDNPALAEGLHFKAPTIFFKILPVIQRFVYLSPDEVYGNVKTPGPHEETTAAAPSTILQKTRFQGESLVIGHKRSTVVFRCGEVFGEPFGWRELTGQVPTTTPQTEAPHWMDDMLRSLQKGARFPITSNSRHSYLYVGDLVRALKAHFRMPQRDSVLYNIGSRGSLTRLEFARKMSQLLGYEPALIKAPAEGLSVPDYSLSPKKFETTHDFQFSELDDALDEFAARLREGYTSSWA